MSHHHLDLQQQLPEVVVETVAKSTRDVSHVAHVELFRKTNKIIFTMRSPKSWKGQHWRNEKKEQLISINMLVEQVLTLYIELWITGPHLISLQPISIS